jgi:hypothetical protein
MKPGAAELWGTNYSVDRTCKSSLLTLPQRGQHCVRPIRLRMPACQWRSAVVELGRRDLCCVFAEMETDTSNGQRSPACSATFYEIKLQDFLKP